MGKEGVRVIGRNKVSQVPASTKRFSTHTAARPINGKIIRVLELVS